MRSGVPTLQEIGFSPTDLRVVGIIPGMSGAQRLVTRFCAGDGLEHYAGQRDFPAIDGGSHLSIHLRFGTVSIRELVRRALTRGARNGHDTHGGPATWLSELIWRDFYFMILDHFPHVAERAFKPEYDAIEWEKGELADACFAAWCAGKTGYPLVDAAMRQINGTGYMHNRLRMLVASFLTKDLGIDWRRGEAYFAVQAKRLRPCGEQRRLAMGGFERLRRAAVFPDFQPGDAVERVSIPKGALSAASCRN